MRIPIAVAAAITATAITAFAQDQVQAAIQRGDSNKTSEILKQIRKQHSFSIAKYPVSLKVTVFTPNDLVAIAESDAKRRHQQLSPDSLKEFAKGIYKVQLEANSGGVMSLKVRQWEPPEVHMTLTVNGNELQPATENLGSAYAQAFGNVLDVKTMFTFEVPVPPRTMAVTIISSGGTEKNKEIELQKLMP